MMENIVTNCRRREGKLSQSEMRQRIIEMRMSETVSLESPKQMCVNQCAES